MDTVAQNEETPRAAQAREAELVGGLDEKVARLEEAPRAAQAREAELVRALDEKDEQLRKCEGKLASASRMVEQQRKQLDEYLARLRRDRLNPENPDQLVFLDLLQEIEDEARTAAEDLEQEESDKDPEPDKDPKRRRRAKRPHRGRLPLPEHLPRREVLVDFPEDEKVDPLSGKPLIVVRYMETEKLEVVPARYEVVVYRRPVYAMPEGNGMQTPEMPLFAIDKCIAANGMLADIAVKRFVDHMPYYRQAHELARARIPLHRNQLDEWMLTLAEKLAPLHKALLADVRGSDYIGFDDTGIPMQVKGKGSLHSARMWAMRRNAGPPHVAFVFSMTKEKHEAVALLDRFRGWAQADAYAGHDEVMAREGVVEVGCWAHAIRRFKDAVLDHGVDATRIVKLINRLYAVERDADRQKLAPEQRQALRQTKSQPILDDIFSAVGYLKEVCLPKSKLARAATYCLNQRVPLSRYIEDGRLLIDNNEVERSLRPLGIGRKNWLFVVGPRGGPTAAVFLSLFGSCRNLKLNPWLYMKDVLDRIPTHPQDQMRDLLPAYWEPLPQNLELGVPTELELPKN